MVSVFLGVMVINSSRSRAHSGGYLGVIDAGNCDFVTRRLVAMHGYMPRHGKTAVQHNEPFPL